MGNKPVKRSDHIVKLSRDHHATLLFCWKLRQGVRFGVDTGRMKKYVAYFSKDLMLPHFKEEEEVLFAALPKDEQVLRALDEHKHIMKETDRILDSSSGASTHAYLAMADLVDKHVRFEERELFPHLEQRIDRMQLLEIEKQLGDEPLKDNYSDEFWIKEPSSSVK